MTEMTADCARVFELLASSHNVLISGAPGTGKSRLLGEIAEWFVHGIPVGLPVHDPEEDDAPISSEANSDGLGALKIPGMDRASRKVFRTVFHQASKHREFVTGIAPAVSVRGQGGQAIAPAFRVVQGVLYKASEHARAGGAALLIIDEINRGPAVQIFGGSLVAIESDKRLGPDGSVIAGKTQGFELIDPNGELVEYCLPYDLYIVAAMNQADASVAPLDVAFLRRWAPYALKPDLDALYSYFNVSEDGRVLPDVPASPQDVFLASIRAWNEVNARIAVGRGPEFQIGHGVLFVGRPSATSIEAALDVTSSGWARIGAHIRETFFGDLRGIAAVYGVGPESTKSHPLALEETIFADDIRLRITGPTDMSPSEVYRVLLATAR